MIQPGSYIKPLDIKQKRTQSGLICNPGHQQNPQTLYIYKSKTKTNQTPKTPLNLDLTAKYTKKHIYTYTYNLQTQEHPTQTQNPETQQTTNFSNF